MLDFDNRPWGRWEEYLFEPSYRVKRIIVHPGKRLSLQFHELRSEVWVIVQGRALVTVGERTYEAGTGEVVRIERDELHRVENLTIGPLVIIETQLGVCVEDDIIRIEDDFGRVEQDFGH